MPFFKPDRFFSRITKIDVQRDLVGEGFTHLFLDIDNTILTRDTHEVPADVRQWLEEARTAGITVCLLSNNFHHGVYDLAERLQLPIVAKSVKPLPFAYIRAKRCVGAKRKSTVAIGDQLITDVLGAHFVGLKAYLLKPLVATDLWHTLLLRHVESFILGDAEPEDVLEERAALVSRGPCALLPAASGKTPRGRTEDGKPVRRPRLLRNR